MRRKLQLLTIKTLNVACGLIDTIAYRPAIVKLTERLPRSWNCQFTRLSMKLDHHWETEYWKSGVAGPTPDISCEVCGRRPAVWEIGRRDPDEDLGPDADYLERHPIQVCRWCQLDRWAAPVENRQDLNRLIADARSRSVSWRWRWRAL